MNVVPPLIPNAQPAELMQPTQRTLHHPAIHPEPAAVLRVSLGDVRLGPDLAQRFAVCFRVIRAIGVQLVKAIARSADPTGNRRHVVDQIKQFLDIVDIRSRRVRTIGMPLASVRR